MTEQEAEALARRARMGDRAAFERLLDGHYDMMYRVAYRFTGSREDAEDIAQDVCCALPEKLAAFRGESKFTTWLYRVVVNACRDMQKKRGNQHDLAQRYTDFDALQRAESAEANAQVAWLYRQVAALEPALKETALLVLAEDMSHAEAGKVLGCAESTISWRMSEIRKSLKASMESGV